jgi:hypothetical protein
MAVRDRAKAEREAHRLPQRQERFCRQGGFSKSHAGHRPRKFRANFEMVMPLFVPKRVSSWSNSFSSGTSWAGRAGKSWRRACRRCAPSWGSISSSRTARTPPPARASPGRWPRPSSRPASMPSPSATTSGTSAGGRARSLARPRVPAGQPARGVPGPRSSGAGEKRLPARRLHRAGPQLSRHEERVPVSVRRRDAPENGRGGRRPTRRSSRFTPRRPPKSKGSAGISTGAPPRCSARTRMCRRPTPACCRAARRSCAMSA